MINQKGRCMSFMQGTYSEKKEIYKEENKR